MGVATKSSTLAIGFCFPIIGAILLITRFHLRKQRKARVHVDDWFAVSAWLCVTGACASLITGVYNGAFFLTDANDAQKLEHQEHAIAQITGSTVFFWFFANASVKASILFFYRRIFVGRVFNIINWTLIALTATWLVYSFIGGILYCGTHIRENFEGPWSVCPAWAFQLQLPTFLLDTLIDFGILILPIPFLVKLQVEPAKKLLLIIVFGVGGFAFVAGLMNTIYQFLLLTDPTSTAGVAGTPPSPTTNGQLLLLNWPVIEIGVGLIACNLPSLSLIGTRVVSEYIFKGWRSISGTVSRAIHSDRSSRGSRGSKDNSGNNNTAAAGPSLVTIHSATVMRGAPKLSIDTASHAKSLASSVTSTGEYEMFSTVHSKHRDPMDQA